MEVKLKIQNLRLPCFIGIYSDEFEKQQDVIVNIECFCDLSSNFSGPNIDQVVCYVDLSNKIKNLVSSKHYYFIEELAESIANLCLSIDRVNKAKVYVEKVGIMGKECYVGVEIERKK